MVAADPSQAGDWDGSSQDLGDGSSQGHGGVGLLCLGALCVR